MNAWIPKPRAADSSSDSSPRLPSCSTNRSPPAPAEPGRRSRSGGSGGRLTVVNADIVRAYGRSSAGWRPGLSDEEAYAAANGRWKLGARADRERYVVFSAMGIVVLAVEIDHISAPDADGRRTIHDTILKPGSPIYDKYVGNESPVEKSQNPVQYFGSPFDRTDCACGCGEDVPSGRDFLPGHDQRAIHDRVKLVGGVLPFMDWFDVTWPETKPQS